MEKITSLQASVLPVTTLEVKKGDKVKAYTLVLDFNALAKAQQAIGQDLSTIEAWIALWGKITPEQITAICWSALDTYHPEVPLKEVGTWLGTADKNKLFMMLIEQAWPGILDRVEQIGREVEQKAAGEREPNPQPESGPATA